MIRLLKTVILVIGLLLFNTRTGFAQCPTTTYPLCSGESYTLTAQSGLTNIQWQVDNGSGYNNISGATNAVFVASAVGKYKYTAKDANNCTINLCCPFDLVAGTNCTTPCPTTTYPLCSGESYTLTAQSGLTNIQWQVDNGSGYNNISGATNTVFVASAVGKYKYTAKDANNCTIDLCCPFDIVAGTNCATPCPTTTYPLCSGESYTLTAQSGLTNIQWQVDNGSGYNNISGATNTVFVASAVGKYKYTAKDANNCTIDLCCPFDIVAGTNCATPCPTTTYPLCSGESYTLTAQSGLTNIQWQVDNGSGYNNISGATNAIYVASAVGKYKYTAKDANNCTINLCCPFDIIAGTNCTTPCPTTTYPLCSGESYTLTAQSGLTNIQWQVDNGSGYNNISGATNAVYVASAVGKYKYTAKDANNCTINLCCPFDIIAETNCTTPCPTTTYPLCSGESYTLTAQSGLTNIQWQVDNGSGYNNISGATNAIFVASAVGKYKYTAKDANNCAINLCCPFDIVAGTNCTTPCPTTTYPLCSGESYTLTAQSGLTNIQWQVDNGSGYNNILGATNAIFVASAVGKYKYTAKDANNCTINLCCPFDIVAGTNCTTPCPTTTYPLCSGESYTLTAQSGLTNIQWQVDNGSGYTNISGATNAIFVASAVGKYKYTAKDANNCTINLCCPFDIVAGTNCTTPCPTTTYPLCSGESYTLTAQSGLTNIQWQVDNGSGYTNISGATNAIFVASAVGKYKYTAKDANNCTIDLCCPFELVANPTPDFTLSKSIPCPGTLEDVNITNLVNALPTTSMLSIDGRAFSAFPNLPLITGLSVGNHNITIRNANGCSKAKSITISPATPNICIPITITRVR